MIKGWKHLVITSHNFTTSLKPKAEWTDAEDNENFKGFKCYFQ